MAINETIWGAPETWVNSRNNSDLNNSDVKVGASGYSTYADQYTAERIALNEIDTSPCFWGISSASMWGSMYAAYAYAPNGLESPIEIGEKLVSEPHENGLPLMLIDSTMASPLQYGLGYGKRYTPVESNIMGDNAPYTRDVVLDFNYQKILCYPQLLVMTENYTTEYATFETYFDPNNSNYRDSHPYICAITYTMYLGSAGSRIGESSGIVPLIPYSFSGNNEQYESRYEFSADGFSALKTSYITNSTNAGIILSCDNTGAEITVNYNTPNATVATDDTGYRYRYCINEPNSDDYYPVPLYVHDDSGLWEYIRISSTWWDIACVIDIQNKDIADVREYILKQIAYLGFPFIVAYADRQKAIGTAGVYLPVFDENGVTTGDYVEGADALELPNAEWTDGRSSGYDPNRPPTPDDGDTGDLNNVGAPLNRFTSHSYTVWALYGENLSNNDLRSIISAVNNMYITDPDGVKQWQLDFKGANPSDYIVGLYAYPLSLPHTETSYTFTLGAVEFDSINVNKYSGDGYFSFGSVDFKNLAFYGDFRDYPPYSSAEIYIPFCGTTSIDLPFFVGHSMTVIMFYDIYTGACSAAIYRDGVTLYKVLNGQIGVQIPLTSVRAGDYQNNIHALENALKQNEMRLATSALTLGLSAGAAVATGGASLALGVGAVAGSAGMLGTAQERDNIEYKLQHTQPAPAQTGASETQNGYRVGGKYVKLYIKRAKMLSTYNEAEYAHTVGHACVINTTINSVCTEGKNSLIQCSNVDLSGVTATAAEISAIQNLLTSGVYV